MTTNAGLREILTICRTVERSAADSYKAISEGTAVEEHKAFWQDVSRDEEDHIAYWDRLLELADKGDLLSPFEDPDDTLTDLRELKARLERPSDGTGEFTDVSKSVLRAFELESMMLHPAFAIAFRSLKDGTQERSPEEDYQEHIDKFSGFTRRVLSHKPEVLFISDLLSKMWKRSRQLAIQVVDVKALRHLIPICANCKRIRDDQGFWNQIESYLSTHTEARFTHGLCPQCKEELYSGFLGKNK